MQNKTLRSVLIAVVAIVLVICSFGGGFVAGQGLPVNLFSTPTVTPSPTQDGGTPQDLQTLFGPFWQAWDLVHQNSLYQPLDDAKLVQGAISGMMEAVGDPYTGYWNPKETNDVMTSMSGEYDGIGAWVDTGEDFLTIIEAMPGSPAEAAGLKHGDQIVAVNGEDVTGVDPELIRSTKVMGPAGTDVVLTIRREGVEEPFDVTITRAHIVVPGATSEILDNGIGYLQIYQFGDNTASEVHDILANFKARGVTGIILDLRNNPGGLTDAATSIASEFIGEGVIWYEQYGNGSRVTHAALPGGLVTDIPLVVLVNENSASASELVAGAIQDHGRGQLVGVTTFGKGLVQQWYPLSDGGTARVTVAQWLTPNGRAIDKVGLKPDVVVEMTEDDYDNNRDPQKDAAIQLLLNP